MTRLLRPGLSCSMKRNERCIGSTMLDNGVCSRCDPVNHIPADCPHCTMMMRVPRKRCMECEREAAG